MHPDDLELSDLIVDYDPDTLERRPVRWQSVLEYFQARGSRSAARIVRSLPRRGEHVPQCDDEKAEPDRRPETPWLTRTIRAACRSWWSAHECVTVPHESTYGGPGGTLASADDDSGGFGPSATVSVSDAASMLGQFVRCRLGWFVLPKSRASKRSEKGDDVTTASDAQARNDIAAARGVDGSGETSRRELLKAAGALGIGSVLAGSACATHTGATASPNGALGSPTVPMRPFGRTGISVSSLALGGYFDALANQSLLELAMELGVTYWETTLGMGGKGYGEYFKRYPAARSKVFLLAKTKGNSPEQMDADLTTALTDVGTSHIDFFIIGSIRDGSLLTDDVRRWASAAKAKGLIRYFGFSTHANMEESLTLASNLGWIDGVMTTYNYRLMHQPGMQRAVEACARQGIALTAIKSQALETNPEATIGDDTPAAGQALRKFLDQGQNLFEARLRAVWENPNISSICSMMTDPGSLRRNATASWQRAGSSELPSSLATAERTTQRYCAGCATVCESTLQNQVPIADVMRYLMYARSYADKSRAQKSFARLPGEVRAALPRHDYSLAEARCPQRLPIGQLMADAHRELQTAR